MSNPKEILGKLIMAPYSSKPIAKSNKAIAQLIARVFTTRNLTHFEHWGTSSYAKHMALGDLYDEIVSVIDEVVEVYQGKNGLLEGLYVEAASMPCHILERVEEEAKWIGENRKAISEDCEAIGAILDTLDAAYLKAIYKLKNLN